MKLLLDTHIWLWYLLGDQRLSSQLQTTIVAPNTELWLSPISIWETLILAEKKRISLHPDPITWVNLALKTLKTREAEMNYAIAILSRQISLPHQDPADRFIVATAMYYGLTLATVDANIISNSAIETVS
ncbi:MAG: PIN domain-containing protein [Limnospira sp. PMC 1291.21]|uniref:type II toxin-antitoxin system VapC family toxin n=1 Tax=unclassified Limnospira TaxID=2642885 RepID=UPI0028E13142|nr:MULTISPECIES: PIN domain-containing protein [unclassified Limnospira]MDT9176322.1 PIN domain-containing protein [Limnospira sp. PMC 1238.20]MDT9191705.1 PIN domain-containing protein [Limnospira sp. PMC 1245.20]MDT9201705.1 PIN domain-containing protein [Limnospira sp. PMC 1243.20]MDT9207127.1 PIN domain-containing protein [Limnospira sp. PMC 1252.20]MDT9212198.1 PIN domain-containing protein [Limnospira sp. PMC 1256.20]